jgi:hypothetical protein
MDIKLPEASHNNPEPTVTVAELMGIIAELSKSFVTREEARAIVKEELPQEFANLAVTKDNISGDVLRLNQSATAGQASQAYWGAIGSGSGLEVEGDQVLYKGIFLREYDADGVIVAPGSEIGSPNTLKATWDVARWI